MLQLQKTPELRESEITLFSENSHIEGTLELGSVARIHGSVKGRLTGRPGSLIVLGQRSRIEGSLECDELWIEGFVRGDIVCRTKVVLASTARVVGDVTSPSISIEPGAYFEGSCKSTGPIPGSDTTPPSA